MRINNTSLITAGDASGDITSETYAIDHVGIFAIQGVMSGGGSPVGSFTVEGSCDDDRLKPSEVTNFTVISDLTTAISADGNFLANRENAGWNWLRVKYARSSGSGTLNVRINTKGF